MYIEMRRWTGRGVLAGVLLWGALGQAKADPGDRKRIGGAGEWKNTVVGASLKNQLYTIESDGTLYVTNLETGKWKPLGSAKYSGARSLHAAGNTLYACTGNGDLYSINPNTGARKRLGAAGVWKNVIKAASLGGQLYCVTGKGALYRTSTTTGRWTVLDKSNYGETALMMAQEKASYSSPELYTIEKSGSLYKVNQTNGSWEIVGKEGAWKGSKAGVIASDLGQIFTINAQGALRNAILSYNGAEPMTLGKPIYGKTTHLFVSGNSRLYALDSDGSLYSVEMAPLAG